MDQPVPADRHRDPAAVARVTALARQVLVHHGVDLRTARRAGGWSNFTWLAGGLALQIEADAERGDLLRTARLAALLPPGVGYPRIIASGLIEEHEWLLTEEAPGVNLGAVWPQLGWDQRARALGELWAKVEVVHSVNSAAAAPHVRPQSPFYAPTPAAAVAQFRQLEARIVLPAKQSTALRAILARFWAALPGAAAVLNHGDLTTENALWYEGLVVTLLDFEFAVLAPVELDANELLGLAYAPAETDDALPDPIGAGNRRLQEAATRAVLPALARPGARDRLLGYAVLLQLWAMHKWLVNWDGRQDYTAWAPFRALTALAEGDGGYLAPVLPLLG
ncbi:MAG TPA: aminoglycoside phosphotransferase family protein [Chloroflexota bacterium]